MEGFKEFQGKDLDSAIGEACAYFNTTREQLEIEIVRDAKSGIFGIVGSRKALVRARRAQLQEAVSSILAQTTRKDIPRQPLRRSQERVRQGGARVNRQIKSPIVNQAPAVPTKKVNKAIPKSKAKVQALNQDLSLSNTENIASVTTFLNAEEKLLNNQPLKASASKIQETLSTEVTPKEVENKRSKSESAKRSGRKSTKPAANLSEESSPKKASEIKSPNNLNEDFDIDNDLDIGEEFSEGLNVITKAELEQTEFKQLLEETLKNLVKPIVGKNVRINVSILESRLCVHLDSGDDSGLLIGREGQTLLSIQYLTSRILTHKLRKIVRLQLDAGEYRTRQKDKLVDMLMGLVEKVRNLGRSFSTKPLSAYHRRLVHLTLQDYPDIQTRSIGNGILKRVVIMPKRQSKSAKKR